MAQQTPGMKCPNCDSFIPTTIAELLTSPGITCPACRLTLTINREESKRAMEILKDVNQAQQNLESTAKKYK